MCFPLLAQESTDTDTDDDQTADEEFEMSDEELADLLTRVDRFFIDQDMARLTVDLDIIRDPSNRLDEDSIRDSNPARIAGLSTMISHYEYGYPGYYLLQIMGETLASSELPPEQTFFSQLLPLPGAPIYTDAVKERFRITFQGLDEVEGIEAYKVKYLAINRDTEFFNYITYYISIEEETILRVESSFDNAFFVGSGQGNFYYDDWLGKYLPIYGHGTVIFQNPVRRFNIWGRWYRWDWQSAEEMGIDPVTGESVACDDPAGSNSAVETTEEETPTIPDEVNDEGESE